MLTLVRQDGTILNVDTTQLDEVAPVILFNDSWEDGIYQMVDFDPVGDLENARFIIFFIDGSEEEFSWEDQSDDAQYDVSQLDNPM